MIDKTKFGNLIYTDIDGVEVVVLEEFHDGGRIIVPLDVAIANLDNPDGKWQEYIDKWHSEGIL